MRFTFREAKAEDKELIHSWLSQDYIRQWIHGEGLANTLSDLEISFAGKAFFKHWIAFDQKIPFGYLLTSPIDKGGDDKLAKACSQQGEAITLDVFIGDERYLGKGLCPLMMNELLESQFPDVTEVVIDPEVANQRAVHVYQKAGFQIIEEFIAKWHPVPHYLMKMIRKPN